MLLRARTVLPLNAPPIENGAVTISGERILAVGRWDDLRSTHDGEAIDLGEVILLPGLINAHCHLDYTAMAGQLAPAKYFSDWIKAIVALKAQWSYTEFARSWLDGANMLLRSGTTTVVDIEAVPELVPDVTQSTPLRVISCLELLSMRHQRSAAQMLESAVAKLKLFPANSVGLSPHAPYSTTPELLRASSITAREHGWLLTTHVAESADEFEMYSRASGAMFDWLNSQRDMSDCGQCFPVTHLARQGALSRNFLAVHANYLGPGDAELLAHSGASVVHCPRSHAYFSHRAFPFQDLQQAGVNVCLGTDSLATTMKKRGETLSLDMFAEMRAFSQSCPTLSPEQVLATATSHAANALNRKCEIGVLAPGAFADLIAVPFAHGNCFETVVTHHGDVTASMIHGQWAIQPPRL